MRISAIVAIGCAALAGGCKKKGGGGGAWLVGEDGLMANLRPDGTLGPGYDLGASGDLRGITCLDDLTAFVVGDGGVFLRTFDGGASWERRDVGTTASLRHVDAAWGSIYVAGEDGLYRSTDLGDTWSAIDASSGWRAIAVDDEDAGAIALDDDGQVWRWDGALSPVAHAVGARRVHVSHDGRVAAIAGDDGALQRSVDGGATWEVYEVPGAPDLDGVWADDDGSVQAVGAAGTFASVATDGTVRVAGFGGPDLHALYLEPTTGYAVGDDGAVYHTDGVAWTRLDLGLTGRILAVEDLDGGW
jgi:photosystem II stability/assembly factor-like uncharacterized protein